ncbi:MAG: nucleotidyltransferase domain-containing protein [Asticcacaulis sp.]
MKTIMRITFGSHLYGTATAASDLDVKAIYWPEARDILLQRVRPSVSGGREKAHGEKNTAADVDFEAYSPAKFLELLAEGQTVALDMLFAPDALHLDPPHPVWSEIQALAPRLFSRQTTAFVGYCRQQARKYVVKGERLTAVRQALETLRDIEARYGANEKLEVAAAELMALTARHPLVRIVHLPEAGGFVATYLDVAGKKAIFSASIKAARAMTEKLYAEFGERSRAAEANQGVDWKSISHAVRIARQAVEFLETRHIVFPRPEAMHLLAIKRGEVPYQVVEEEIESLLETVETIAETCDLPDGPPENLADDFIADLYGRIVREAFK